ncbi:MAG TPA: c-type cytochrome domain-containing protein, partial [Prosthecobacter sp.]|nr:c-type cytochrome domain-containing protein [Prosthecobacter sp.]
MFRSILVSGAVLMGGGVMAANAPLPVNVPTIKGALDYERDVYPILKANCIACHNKTTTKADLNMETPDLMKKGGESGAGLVPGKAADSAIFQAAVHTWESPMPPKGNKVGAVNLKPEELGLLKRWIDEGAKGALRKTRQIAWQPLPPGLNPVYAATLTADGRWAACSRANQIWLYDLGTRQMHSKLTDDALIKEGLYKQPGVAHRDVVQALAFTPDGLWLASGSFQEIKLWRRQSPQPVAIKTQVPPGTTTAQSPDGKKLAAAGADGVIKITDAASKAVLREIRGDLASTRAGEALKWEIARQQLEINYQTDFVAKTEAEVKALGERRKKAQDAIATAKKAVEDKTKALPAAEAAKAAAEKDLQAAKVAVEGKTDAALEKKAKEAQDKLDKAMKDLETAMAAVKTAQGQVGDAEAEVKDITEAEAKASKTLADAKAAQDSVNKALAAAKAASAKPAAFDAAKDGITALAFSADSRQLAAVTVLGTLNIWSVETGSPLELHPGKATGAAVPAVAAAPEGGFVWTQPDGSAWSIAG